MTEIKDKELQEFWEGCGIHFVNVLAYAAWEDSEGNVVKHPDSIPLTLDNLFKYAVPKLVEELREKPDVRHKDNAYSKLFNMWLELLFYTDYKDPAEALYQAIQKARKVNYGKQD